MNKLNVVLVFPVIMVLWGIQSKYSGLIGGIITALPGACRSGQTF